MPPDVTPALARGQVAGEDRDMGGAAALGRRLTWAIRSVSWSIRRRPGAGAAASCRRHSGPWPQVAPPPSGSARPPASATQGNWRSRPSGAVRPWSRSAVTAWSAPWPGPCPRPVACSASSRPAAAAGVLLDGQPRAVDLIGVQSGDGPEDVVAGSVYLGIPSVGGEIANRSRWVRGPVGYQLAGVRALLGWRPTTFTVDPGVAGWAAASFPGFCVVVANSVYLAAGSPLRIQALPGALR